MERTGDKFFQRLANLECSAGHRFFAPTPAVWVDRVCGRKDRDNKSCKRRQMRIKGKK